MRIAHLAALSMLYVGIAGCGSKDEDCSDNADNDGDAAVDCDDSDCNADAACEGGDADTDADSDSDSDSDSDADVDCTDAANCAETECAGTELCDEVLASLERGAGTANETEYDVAGTTGFFAYPIDTFDGATQTGGENICSINFDQTGTIHSDAADCDGCDFAFQVVFSNSTTATGSGCETLGVDTSTFTVDDAEYGYGYNPTYDNDGEPVPALMYFDMESSEWVAASSDVTADGDDFSYSWVFNLYYY